MALLNDHSQEGPQPEGLAGEGVCFPDCCSIESLDEHWGKEIPEASQPTASSVSERVSVIVQEKEHVVEADSTASVPASGPQVDQHLCGSEDMGSCSSNVLITPEMQIDRSGQSVTNFEISGPRQQSAQPSGENPVETLQIPIVSIAGSSGNMLGFPEGGHSCLNIGLFSIGEVGAKQEGLTETRSS